MSVATASTRCTPATPTSSNRRAATPQARSVAAHLRRDRPVRRAGRDHHRLAGSGAGRRRRARPAPRRRSPPRPARPDGGGGGVVHPGGPGERGRLQQRREAGDGLRRRLAGGVHDLRACRCAPPGPGRGGRTRDRRCAAFPRDKDAGLAVGRGGKGDGMSIVKINAITVPPDRQAAFRGALPRPGRRGGEHPRFRVVRAAASAGGHRPVPGVHPLGRRGVPTRRGSRRRTSTVRTRAAGTRWRPPRRRRRTCGPTRCWSPPDRAAGRRRRVGGRPTNGG